MKRIAAILCAVLILFSSASPIYADNGSTTVYITNTGQCYHRGSCSYLRQSKIAISLEEASRRYRPCSRCNPPRYDGAASSVTRSSSGHQAESPSPLYTVVGIAGVGIAGYLIGQKKRNK